MSPGFDGITIDHFKYAFPCVVLLLKHLFELMLYAGCVPDDFAQGVLQYPYQKKKTK